MKIWHETVKLELSNHTNNKNIDHMPSVAKEMNAAVLYTT